MSRVPRSQRLGLLRRPISSTFDRCVIVVAAGGVRTVVADEWRDTLVEIEHGDIELELDGDTHLRRSAGDVLWLHGLGVRRLRNRGPRCSVLVAIRRHPPR